jgi:hypothetical protein
MSTSTTPLVTHTLAVVETENVLMLHHRYAPAA